MPNSRTSFAPALAILLLLASSARADNGIISGVSYPDFSSTMGLTLNGSAAAVHSADGVVLRVVPATFFAGGSAFSTSQINMNGFSTSFSFRFSQPDGSGGGADGFVFVLQSISSGLGGNGGSLGYEGIVPSVGVEFDVFQNGWDPDNSHVAVLVNGDVQDHKALYSTPTPMLDGNIRYAWIDYDGTTLEVRIATTNVRPATANISYPIDIPATLRQNIGFAGFTAGTGGGDANHDILSWKMDSTFVPGAIIASSDWENAANGVDGWSFFNDGTNLIRVASDGNPGGFLRVTDLNSGPTLYFVAPAKFLGNQSAAYRGALSFDLQQFSLLPAQFDADDVVLIGGGLTLAFDTPANPPPTPAWRSYSIPLQAAAGWKVGSNSGVAATEAQLQTVLSNLTALRIRGEFSIDVDTDGIDNVVLTGAPTFSHPIISQVLDGAALTPDIAQGSVFVVKGSSLSADGFIQAAAPITPPAPTYPAILNKVSITLTSAADTSGTPINMLMAYTFNTGGVNQLAAVVPSTVATGAYNLRVIINGDSGDFTSSPFPVNVVARKPGIVSTTGDGVGIAQATLQGAAILQRNSNVGKIGAYDTRPAHPGDRMDLWGTGLGADTLADSGGTSGDQTIAGQIQVILNGTDVIPAYAGRSAGYPGLDQIVFTIPLDVALKCDNTIQIRAGGTLSNQLTFATSTTDTCPSGN